jgi:hypothetical protein
MTLNCGRVCGSLGWLWLSWKDVSGWSNQAFDSEVNGVLLVKNQQSHCDTWGPCLSVPGSATLQSSPVAPVGRNEDATSASWDGDF